MKKLLVMLTLFLSSFAHAIQVIEVNENEMKLYYQFLPTLEVDFRDLGSEGGNLLMSLDYDPEQLSKELSELQVKYPSYILQRLNADSAGAAIVDLLDILHYEILPKNSQYGPYFTASFDLSQDQVRKLRKIGASAGKLIQVQIPQSFNYSSVQVLERHETDLSACEQVPAGTLKDLVKSFSSLKKPSSIQYTETYESYREDFLRKCFELEPQNVMSFADLLAVKLTKGKSDKIVGVYKTRRAMTKTQASKPNVTFVIQNLGG